MAPPATITASVLTGYTEAARAAGLDPLALLAAVNIPRRALSDPGLRISADAARDLLELCAHTAEDFGLRMHAWRTPSVMGLTALIAREQATVRGMLEAVNRHHALHADSTTLPLEDVDDITIVHLVQSWTVPGPDRQATELGLATIMHLLQQHLGSAWWPLSVSFVHTAPAAVDSRHHVFGPNLAFNQDFNGLVCRRADLDQRNPTADPEMARQVERIIEGVSVGSQAALGERVRAVVARQLASGGCDADMAARELGMDLRTLQRQLAAADTTFGHIVQDTRMGLIPQYLEESDRPLADVAERLGFSALSAFSRWHRAHYGVSASAHRRAARSAAGRPTPDAHGTR